MDGKVSFMSISSAGNSTVTKLCQLTGFIPLPHSHPQGDVEGEGYFFEVKKATKTINQIRIFKWIPIIVHSKEKWYVIPASDLLLMLYNRAGQHGFDPIICVNMNVNLKVLEKFSVNEANLKYSCLEAAVKDKQSKFQDVINQHILNNKANLKECRKKINDLI